MSKPAEIYGLILAGGASRRMGHDKAVIDYHGQPQIRWAYELLQRHLPQVFVSVRAEQEKEPVRASLPQVHDLGISRGPLDGIVSAMQTHHQVAWLVVACDLPWLADASIEHLLAKRDPQSMATAFASVHHPGLPEPLCAIWEPASRTVIDEAVASNRHCPRKILINTNIRLTEQLDPRSMDNINHPQELEDIRKQA
ncbi:MAG: NTP transferase domain-containing protein [Xanthomonadales bacterium]|nr:NTP transferase domain-containing protein [Xanthomonadales bacterium]